jgi:lipoprotein-releasing system permease protein
MLFLAIRHLLARRRQTLIIMSGILMGSCAFILISAMMLGMREFLIRQIISNEAHIRIQAKEESLDVAQLKESLFGEEEFVRWFRKPTGIRTGTPQIVYTQGWFDRMNRDPRIVSYTPHLTINILVKRGSITRNAQLIGTIPSRQISISNIEENMKEGKFENIGQSGNRIVIGDGLMEKLGAGIADTILISTGLSEPVPFKIVGSFHFGIPTDDFIIYGALADVQKISGTPGRITDISVRIADVTEAAAIAGEWKRIGIDKVESWEEINAQFLQIFALQDAIRYVVTGTILVVAAAGIYNVLTILVNQKRKEIAILRSIGFDSKDITQLFFTQGIALGLAGGALGVLLGFLISIYLSTIQFYEVQFGSGGKLPVSFNPQIYITSFSLAMIASAIASLLPARFAGRMTPMEIIRSEES